MLARKHGGRSKYVEKRGLEWLNKEEEVNVFRFFKTLAYMFKLKRKENKTPSEKMALAGFKKLWIIQFAYALFLVVVIVVVTTGMASFWARHDKYGDMMLAKQVVMCMKMRVGS